MSDETNTSTPAPATPDKKEEFVPIPMFDVTRNEVSWSIVQDQIKRGDNKGQPYLRPASIALDSLSAAAKWLGEQMVVDILNAKLALMGNNITDTATDDDGKLDLEKAKAYFADFSTRGETKADLEDKRDALVKEMTAVSVNANMSMEDRIAKITELGQNINKLTETIESKTRERGPRKPKTAEGQTAPAEQPAQA